MTMEFMRGQIVESYSGGYDIYLGQSQGAAPYHYVYFRDIDTVLPMKYYDANRFNWYQRYAPLSQYLYALSRYSGLYPLI